MPNNEQPKGIVEFRDQEVSAITPSQRVEEAKKAGGRVIKAGAVENPDRLTIPKAYVVDGTLRLEGVGGSIPSDQLTKAIDQIIAETVSRKPAEEQYGARLAAMEQMAQMPNLASLIEGVVKNPGTASEAASDVQRALRQAFLAAWAKQAKGDYIAQK
ncbi:hypothetical protein IPJ72_00830 [Candidatus Peregrinibacteria bacterium]|nr:MAG: hypothetical protein IPJ72_00830 [Candidatus Peregrinibacteria bacterium]